VYVFRRAFLTLFKIDAANKVQVYNTISPCYSSSPTIVSVKAQYQGQRHFLGSIPFYANSFSSLKRKNFTSAWKSRSQKSFKAVANWASQMKF